jgi:hypothetical protein
MTSFPPRLLIHVARAPPAPALNEKGKLTMKKRRETTQQNEKRNGFPNVWERPPYPIEMLITFGLGIGSTMAYERLPTHHHSSPAIEHAIQPACGAIFRTIDAPVHSPRLGLDEHQQFEARR